MGKSDSVEAIIEQGSTISSGMPFIYSSSFTIRVPFSKLLILCITKCSGELHIYTSNLLSNP